MKTAPIALAALAIATPASAARTPAEIVKAKIAAGAQACMSGRADAVTASYAPDILLLYPGVPDQTLDDLRKAYGELCGTGEGTVESTVPTFKEVYTSGPVVVARITWKTRLRGMSEGKFRYLRDVQVWEKRKGDWLFVRGAHFPAKAP